MRITLLAIGKKHDPGLKVAVDEYTDRLNRAIPVGWQILPPSGKPEPGARKEESTAILQRIKANAVVWLLDERGEQIQSPALADKINTMQYHGVQELVFIIGGAYGVDDSVRQRADFVWSLSKLIFPHQMVRLMLAEQLYRATEINRGSGYHHV